MRFQEIEVLSRMFQKIEGTFQEVAHDGKCLLEGSRRWKRLSRFQKMESASAFQEVLEGGGCFQRVPEDGRGFLGCSRKWEMLCKIFLWNDHNFQ